LRKNLRAIPEQVGMGRGGGGGGWGVLYDDVALSGKHLMVYDCNHEHLAEAGVNWQFVAFVETDER
jgi:hypothetical protein